MGLKAYRRKTDKKVVYSFEDIKDSNYEKLPPNPEIVHSVRVYMVEIPRLDSLSTIHELDRQLNLEAEKDREDAIYQDLVKTL